jgi:hypothetical protein
MSKQNKTNKTNYVQAGRLTPDDMAREQKKMRTVVGATARDSRIEGRPTRPAPPGARRSASPNAESARRTRRSESEE